MRHLIYMAINVRMMMLIADVGVRASAKASQSSHHCKRAVCFNSLSIKVLQCSSVLSYREKVKVEIGSKSESHLIAARDMQCMMADKCVQSIAEWRLATVWSV